MKTYFPTVPNFNEENWIEALHVRNTELQFTARLRKIKGCVQKEAARRTKNKYCAEKNHILQRTTDCIQQVVEESNIENTIKHPIGICRKYLEASSLERTCRAEIEIAHTQINDKIQTFIDQTLEAFTARKNLFLKMIHIAGRPDISCEHSDSLLQSLKTIEVEGAKYNISGDSADLPEESNHNLQDITPSSDFNNLLKNDVDIFSNLRAKWAIAATAAANNQPIHDQNSAIN
uniref:Uncharacterized protein n=1 Tax=Rhabditophanes sp. KR3021 TaxID=114890 RepID=A0AC35TL19_9BILA